MMKKFKIETEENIYYESATSKKKAIEQLRNNDVDEKIISIEVACYLK